MAPCLIMAMWASAPIIQRQNWMSAEPSPSTARRLSTLSANGLAVQRVCKDQRVRLGQLVRQARKARLEQPGQRGLKVLRVQPAQPEQLAQPVLKDQPVSMAIPCGTVAERHRHLWEQMRSEEHTS